MAALPSVLCLANVRWSSGRQRAQHLLGRCARERRVAYLEEPLFDAAAPRLELTTTEEGVLVGVPHLAPNTPQLQAEAELRRMVRRVLAELGDARPVLWYSSPMAVGFTDHLKPAAIVYDCTQDPRRNTPELLERERWLFERADVVFTDSHSLCRHKRRTTRHPNIHPLLSSVDLRHFGRARELLAEPPDQAEIPHPRVGFQGPLDERVDAQLLAHLARARPNLQFVLLGPIIDLDLSTLSSRPNVHWLGAKPREQIPTYLAGWDVAMLPLVRSDATRFSCPTQTAEYLAAGKPVVSTSIPDVVEPYGRNGLVWIGDSPGEFADAIDEALASDRHARVTHADRYLFDHDWQATWDEMWTEIERAIASRARPRAVGVRRGKPIDPTYSVAPVQR